MLATVNALFRADVVFTVLMGALVLFVAVSIVVGVRKEYQSLAHPTSSVKWFLVRRALGWELFLTTGLLLLPMHFVRYSELAWGVTALAWATLWFLGLFLISKTRASTEDLRRMTGELPPMPSRNGQNGLI